MRSRMLFLMLAVLIVAAGILTARWSAIERLVTPGHLSLAHAELEARCSACHIAFTPLAERPKCKTCHQRVAADIDQRKGFHGRTPEVREAQCRSCHVEHRGRKAPLVVFDKARFDHHKTDFPVEGLHKGLGCARCHAPPPAKFRAAPSACIACHAKDDIHKQRFGRDCASCHTDRGWRIITRFDHGKTGFPLVGAHQQTKCTLCHTSPQRHGTPRTCVACHQTDDVHKGGLGPNCASCHTPVSWKDARLDHDRTRFPLIGRHRAVSCAQCHGAGHELRKPATTCSSCHRTDDVHRGSLGSDCATCHSPATWKPAKFDHHRVVRFQLRGAHRRVTCASCHRQPATKVKPPNTCIGCHAANDVHRGALGRECATCHVTDSWKPAPLFNHARTRFSLTGAHNRLACATCHRTASFQAAGTTCASCHADAVHKGRFGTPTNCASCHTTSNWLNATFDHGLTRFPLVGKHARTSCTSCHRRATVRVSLATTCVSCHKDRHPHEGRFGNRCETCHTSSESFRNVRVPAAAMFAPPTWRVR
jgi:hypothetical protein